MRLGIMQELDSMASVIWFNPSTPLVTFIEMWSHVFLWALFSSILVHCIAALIAFCTLRKHRVGRFFPVFIILMGVLTPATSGLVTSGIISFIYRASTLQMYPLYAFFYGTGQTVMGSAFSFTRILATL